jgi:putative ABC transport system permease protein
MDSLLRDIRYALRNLRKDPKFTFVAVFALALGIGASTVVFSVFYNLLFNAFAAKDAVRLVVPVIEDAESPGMEYALTLPLTELDAIRHQNRVFENIVGYVMAGGFVLANDGPQTYQFFCTRVTSDAFDFYGVPALLGRGILPDDGQPGAAPVFVMSSRAWNSSFQSDPGILGRTMIVDGEPRTLVGIMPPRFQAFGTQAEIWIPLNRARDSGNRYADFPGELLARLKPGVTVQAASADLNVIVRNLAALHPKDFPKRFSVRVQTAADYQLWLASRKSASAFFHSDLKHLLYDLLAAISMLLLIACSNVANLLLSRATAREKEMAVRTALGATRGRLVQQLLAESALLALAACMVGCALAWVAMQFVAVILPSTGDIFGGTHIGSETGLGFHPPVLFFTLGLTALTTLLCGMAPAFHVSRVDLQPQLAGSGKSGNSGFRHGRFRAALVIAEVTLSIVLLVGAGLMMRSFFLLTHVDLGFNPKNVLLTAFMPPPSRSRLPAIQRFASPEGQAVLRDVVQRLKALPGVTQVAVEDTLPGYGPSRAGFEASVQENSHSEEVGAWAGDENLLQTLEFRLIQGRWFSDNEVRTAQHVGVLTQRTARDFFGSANPIGQQMKIKAIENPSGIKQDLEFQVVGVVADLKTVGPQNPGIPIVFLPYTVRGGFSLLLKTSVNPASLRRAVQEQVWAVDREEVIPLASSLEDFLQKLTYATPEFGLLIATPLAAIALLLVLIGVFSVMAYTVSLRTQEIGVRMALGAQQGDVLRMVLRHGFVLIAAGLAIGLLASFALTRFLAAQIWGVSPTDPWTFGSVALLLMIAGLSACYLPARQATEVDPLVALRYE